MSVTGLTEVEVNTFDDVERILTLGIKFTLLNCR